MTALCLIDRKWCFFFGTFAGYARQEIGCWVIWKIYKDWRHYHWEMRTRIWIGSISLVWPRSYRATMHTCQFTRIADWLSLNLKIIWKWDILAPHFQIQIFFTYYLALNCFKINKRILLHCCRCLWSFFWDLVIQFSAECVYNRVSRKGWFGYSIF